MLVMTLRRRLTLSSQTLVGNNQILEDRELLHREFCKQAGDFERRLDPGKPLGGLESEFHVGCCCFR
jgi:hypothetical protein